MRKILVLGMSGAGKTTLALELGRRLGLPVVHLDRVFWKPGWRESTWTEFDRKVDRLLKKPRWIMDGYYGRTLKRRLRRADTVIFLDYPRWFCFVRIFKRLMFWRKRPRPDLPKGCCERIDWGFIRWTWDFNSRNRKTLDLILHLRRRGVRVYRFTRPRQTRMFLKSFMTTGRKPRPPRRTAGIFLKKAVDG
jgi:adenylate kinase family enzyme